MKEEEAAQTRASQLQEAEAPPSLQLLVFALGQGWYGVEASYVRRVARLREIAPLPCAPSHLLGLMNLQGRVVSVLDLRPLLGLPSSPASSAARAIVVEVGGLITVILAEAVSEVAGASLDRGGLPAVASHGRPVLGEVQLDDQRSVAVLDLPGILTGLMQ